MEGYDNGESGVETVLDLGFGSCKLQVQVPEKGNIERPEQLVGRNVVTSFTYLAEAYFRRLEEQEDSGNGVALNGVSTPKEKRKLRTTIKYVGGSVEAACALGVADGIVDLVGKFAASYVKINIVGNGVQHVRSNETALRNVEKRLQSKTRIVSHLAMLEIRRILDLSFI